MRCNRYIDWCRRVSVCVCSLVYTSIYNNQNEQEANSVNSCTRETVNACIYNTYNDSVMLSHMCTYLLLLSTTKTTHSFINLSTRWLERNSSIARVLPHRYNIFFFSFIRFTQISLKKNCLLFGTLIWPIIIYSIVR